MNLGYPIRNYYLSFATSTLIGLVVSISSMHIVSGKNIDLSSTSAFIQTNYEKVTLRPTFQISLMNKYEKKRNSLDMTIEGDSAQWMDFSSVAEESIFNFSSPASASFLELDSSLEAEVLGDLAHLSLDILTLVTVDPLVMKSCIVLGRTLAIMSDYIPDHSMTMDEVFFQFMMLIVSLNQLFRSLKPIVEGNSKSMSFQDRKIYHKVFKNAGWTWLQFKKASPAFRWIQLDPDVDCDEKSDAEGCLVYVLHKGNVMLSSEVNDSLLPKVVQDKQVSMRRDCETVTTTTIREHRRPSPSDIVFGDIVQVLHLIDESLKTKSNVKPKKRMSSAPESKKTSITNSKHRWKAGGDGATLLVMNGLRLMDIIRDDEAMARSLRTFLLDALVEL